MSSECCNTANEISSFDITVSIEEEVCPKLLGMSCCSLVVDFWEAKYGNFSGAVLFQRMLSRFRLSPFRLLFFRTGISLSLSSLFSFNRKKRYSLLFFFAFCFPSYFLASGN